eukprot:2805532-Pleurochrysis_carterae.AAC.3
MRTQGPERLEGGGAPARARACVTPCPLILLTFPACTHNPSPLTHTDGYAGLVKPCALALHARATNLKGTTYVPTRTLTF